MPWAPVREPYGRNLQHQVGEKAGAKPPLIDVILGHAILSIGKQSQCERTQAPL